MSELRTDESLSREELLALVRELRQTVATLVAELERARRGQHRQAAPFSKGTRVGQPKRPGRRPGEGPFEYRAAPTLDATAAPPVAVPVSEPSCPRCGGTLAFERVDEVTVTDLPEVVRPPVRRYRVAVCRCAACGQAVRGQHPAVAPDQYGATAHRVGPRALAAAHAVNLRP